MKITSFIMEVEPAVAVGTREPICGKFEYCDCSGLNTQFCWSRSSFLFLFLYRLRDAT